MVRELTSIGGWSVVNQIGTLLYLSIDLFVINKVLGPVAGGRYSALLVWPTLLRTMAGYISGIFAPTFVKYFANEQWDDVRKYADDSIRLVGIVIGFPTAFVAGMSVPILSRWLGPSWITEAPLLCVMLFHLVVNLAVMPLFGLQAATNKLQVPGIVTLIAGLLNLALSWWLCSVPSIGIYGVPIAGAILLTAKNIFFTPIYVYSLIPGKKPRNPIYTLLPPIILSSVVGGGLYILTKNWIHSTWIGIMGVGLLTGFLYAIVVYYLVLHADERDRVNGLIAKVGIMRK
jgi:membrane protein EpsK